MQRRVIVIAVVAALASAVAFDVELDEDVATESVLSARSLDLKTMLGFATDKTNKLYDASLLDTSKCAGPSVPLKVFDPKDCEGINTERCIPGAKIPPSRSQLYTLMMAKPRFLGGTKWNFNDFKMNQDGVYAWLAADNYMDVVKGTAEVIYVGKAVQPGATGEGRGLYKRIFDGHLNANNEGVLQDVLQSDDKKLKAMCLYVVVFPCSQEHPKGGYPALTLEHNLAIKAHDLGKSKYPYVTALLPAMGILVNVESAIVLTLPLPLAS